MFDCWAIFNTNDVLIGTRPWFGTVTTESIMQHFFPILLRLSGNILKLTGAVYHTNNTETI